MRARQYHIPLEITATIYKIIKTIQTVNNSTHKMYLQIAHKENKMATMSAMCHARE